jgi:hypothetical protein
MPRGPTDVLPRNPQTWLLAAALPFMAACAAAPSAPDAAPVVAAVIVKPREPASAESIVRSAQATLGRDAGVRYVRPMAGGAHILYLTGEAKREQVPVLVERLRATSAFEYVELDSMMKIQ